MKSMSDMTADEIAVARKTQDIYVQRMVAYRGKSTLCTDIEDFDKETLKYKVKQAQITGWHCEGVCFVRKYIGKDANK